MGVHALTVVNGGARLYNIAEDCGEFDGSARNGFNCILAAISSVVGFAV